MLVNSSGHLTVTVVDGLTLVGIYASDGSMNVFDASGVTTPVGIYHASGAINVTLVDGLTLVGAQAPNGSLNVVNDSAEVGVRHSSGALCVTNFNVSGAATLLASETNGLAIDFTDMSMVIKDTTTPANNYNFSGIVTSAGVPTGPDGKLTYSAPSAKLCLQEDGTYKYGAHNMTLQSNTLATSPWGATTSGTGIAATATDAYAAGPFGGTASRLQMNLNGGTASGDASGWTQTHTLVVGETYVREFWMRSTDGSSSYVVNINGVAGGVSNVTVTGTWTKFSAPTEVCVGAISLHIRLRGAQAPTNSNTADILVWGCHVRRSNSNTDYITTTSAALYALPYEYDTSGNPLGIRVEESRANLFVRSNELTTVWAFPSASVVLNQIGLDGLTSAYTITDTSSGAVGNINQTIASVTSGSTYTFSAYVKRTSGATVYPSMNVVFSTQRAGCTIDTNNATATLWTSYTGFTILTSSVVVSEVSATWMRVSLTITAASTGSHIAVFAPSSHSSVSAVGDFDNTPTGSAVVTTLQFELGAFATSPIITYGTSLTRAADNIFILNTLYPFNGDLVTFYAKVIPPNVATGTYRVAAYNLSGAYSAGNGFVLHLNAPSAAGAGVYSGGNASAAVRTYGSAFPLGLPLKCASVGDDALNECTVTVAGLSVATTITTLDWTGSGDRLQFGALASTGTQALCGHIQQFMMLPRRMTDIELVTVTT